ncbi:MAG TPA: GNAT family N-acetyltransferase [Acidobacteriaceae bacterium]|jgi:predicted GNAT superfamily acetyltransferase|nr:GNAT family N-acetyltransferase [Acidobacteriaceae bacterium]
MTNHIPVTNTSILIRALTRPEEFDACVGLQQVVWKYRDIDVIPRRIFVVARSIGGQVIGAYDGDRLIGFAMALPGIRNGHPYLHSQALAVEPHYRNRGIGAQLKWAQRDDALARGIDLIEWTFDPLAIKNANLNIEKLGAVIRRYTPDFYGVSSSPLHGSLPTDRLHAEWWLRSGRVERIHQTLPLPEYSISVTINVTDINKNSSDVAGVNAASVQRNARSEFIQAFSQKLTVLRLQMNPDGSGSYKLGDWDETWGY